MILIVEILFYILSLYFFVSCFIKRDTFTSQFKKNKDSKQLYNFALGFVMVAFGLIVNVFN